MQVLGILQRGLFAELYVSVGCFGLGGLGAKGDDPVVRPHHVDSLQHVCLEFVLFEYGMVGRRHDDGGLRVALVDDGGIVFSGHNHDLLTPAELFKALEGHLQHRFADAHHVDKLLGCVAVADGPETAAEAACHHDGPNMFVVFQIVVVLVK